MRITPKSSRATLAAVLAIALAVRLAAMLIARDIVDIVNYGKVADAVRGQGLFALYRDTPRMYPYPPLWIWFELAARAADTAGILPFSWAIRLPSILADVGLTALIWRWIHAHSPQRATAAALFYALNPLAIIITSMHGQFDALMLFFVVLALTLLERQRRTWSALALAVAIACKSFPILFLPAMLLALPSARQRIKYALLATLPGGLLFLPFVLAQPQAVMGEVVSYSGSALLGVMVVIWSVYSQIIGAIPLALTTAVISASKWLFLAAYGLLLAWLWRRPRAPEHSVAIVIALFYTAYASIAPQYLFWLSPLLLLTYRRLTWELWAYLAVSTWAVLSLYAYVVGDFYAVAPPAGLARASYGISGSLCWGIGLLILGRLLWLRSAAVAPALPATGHGDREAERA